MDIILTGHTSSSLATASTSVFLLSIAFLQVQGDYPFFWKCPNHFPVQQNFSITKYAGRWYEIEKFLELDEFSGSCTVSEYESLGKGRMSVDIFSIHKRTGKGKITEGRLVPVNATKREGRFKINFKPTWSHLKFPAAYWVLATDYGNYSIVWSCKNSGIINFQGLWFLSRRPRAPDFIRSIVYNKLRGLGIFTRILTHTEQKDCPRLGVLRDHPPWPHVKGTSMKIVDLEEEEIIKLDLDEYHSFSNSTIGIQNEESVSEIAELPNHVQTKRKILHSNNSNKKKTKRKPIL